MIDAFVLDNEARIIFNAYVLGDQISSPENVTGPGYIRTVSYTSADTDKVVHNPPMLSLEKAHDLDAVVAWINARTEQIKAIYNDQASRDQTIAGDLSFSLTLEAKYDGIAVKVCYVNGSVAEMSTRGTGFVGENITRHIPHVVNIHKRITMGEGGTFELRGEILLRAQRLQMINQVLTAGGEEPYANTRNAVSGLLGRNDLQDLADRMPDRVIGLEMVAYAIVSASIKQGLSSEWLADLFSHNYVLTSSPIGYSSTEIQAISDTLTQYQNARDEGAVPFDMDGVVIKVDSLQMREEMDRRDNRVSTKKYPRWALAYKFPPKAETTTLLYIETRVGRTGRITALAHLDPVNIGGVRVSSASLHNFQLVQEKGLCVGDIVRVARMGDVIPQVTHVLSLLRRTDAKPTHVPTNCPSCGSVLRAEGANLFCTSKQQDCKERALAALAHFVSKEACNIQGLARETLEALYDAGLVRSPSDLFRLGEYDPAVLLRIPRFSTTSVKKLLRSISSISTSITFVDLIYALGIPHVGRSTAETMGRAFGEPGEWFACMIDPARLIGSLSDIPLVGAKTVNAVAEFFSDVSNVEEVRALLAHIELHAPTPRLDRTRGTVVFTGTIPVARNVAERHARDNGWEISKSVSSRVSYVIVGDNPSQSKIASATEKQISMIDWDEFFKMTLSQ